MYDLLRRLLFHAICTHGERAYRFFEHFRFSRAIAFNSLSEHFMIYPASAKTPPVRGINFTGHIHHHWSTGFYDLRKGIAGTPTRFGLD